MFFFFKQKTAYEMRISDWSSDVCSSDLHGVPGEDGTVQGMMDLMGIKYTHSGLASSVIAIDKQLTKQTLVPHGIPMPGGMMVESQSLNSAAPLQRPYVLKPINEGSSVGRSEEHTSILQPLIRTSYAEFCLTKYHPKLSKIIT